MGNNVSWQDMLASMRENFVEDSSVNDVEIKNQDCETVIHHKERLDIMFEKKGRGGKSATIIYGFSSFSEKEILELASKMKSRLGTGGSARGNEILIQGDRRNDVLKYLTEAGFKARIV